MNIYVGNLPYSVTERELREMFEPHGTVDKANLIEDRETGRSKGFGFVEMSDDAAGKKAIEELHGQSVEGREITVNEARPREERPRRDFGGGGGRGGDRRGGGGGRDRRGGGDRW